MKSWVIVDDCTSSKSEIFESVCKAQTKEGAYNEAVHMWDELSDFDKNKRDSFFVGYADIDDGVVNWDSMTDVFTIK